MRLVEDGPSVCEFKTRRISQIITINFIYIIKTMILRVKKCGVMTTVQSDKAENGVLNKRTLVL